MADVIVSVSVRHKGMPAGIRNSDDFCTCSVQGYGTILIFMLSVRDDKHGSFL